MMFSNAFKFVGLLCLALSTSVAAQGSKSKKSKGSKVSKGSMSSASMKSMNGKKSKKSKKGKNAPKYDAVQPLLVTPGVGYWAAANVPQYGPPIGQPTVWICFVGSSELTPTTAAACKDGYSPAYSKPPSTALLFTNIGGGEGFGGVEQSLTPAGLSSVASMAPSLKANGFSGVSFDMETLSGFASYNDFSQAMKYAVGNCTAAGLLTLLTTANSGISTGALLNSWPGGTTTFTTFQEDVVPLFDIYSPQCYSSGTQVGSVHDICLPYGGISYAGYSGSRNFWPSVSGKWVQSLDGADPVATLNKNSEQNFGQGITVTGYIVWNKL